jgi:hypothetical protein
MRCINDRRSDNACDLEQQPRWWPAAVCARGGCALASAGGCHTRVSHRASTSKHVLPSMSRSKDTCVLQRVARASCMDSDACIIGGYSLQCCRKFRNASNFEPYQPLCAFLAITSDMFQRRFRRAKDGHAVRCAARMHAPCNGSQQVQAGSAAIIPAMRTSLPFVSCFDTIYVVDLLIRTAGVGSPFFNFTHVVVCPQAPCHHGAAGVPAGAAEHCSGFRSWFSARSAR